MDELRTAIRKEAEERPVEQIQVDFNQSENSSYKSE